MEVIIIRKYLFIFVVILLLIFSSLTSFVYAAGDKVRGVKGVGPTHQFGECPFKG